MMEYLERTGVLRLSPNGLSDKFSQSWVALALINFTAVLALVATGACPLSIPVPRALPFLGETGWTMQAKRHYRPLKQWLDEHIDFFGQELIDFFVLAEQSANAKRE